MAIPSRKVSVNSVITFRTASENLTSTRGVSDDNLRLPNTLNDYGAESLATGTDAENRRSNPGPRSLQSLFAYLRTSLRPSGKTVYTAILGSFDGLASLFVVMASLTGTSDAHLIMLAGLAELIAGAISMGAAGILGANSRKERRQVAVSHLTRQIEKSPECVLDFLMKSLDSELPAFIISDIATYCQRLPIQEKVALVLRFRSCPNPSSESSLKVAATFFLTYFSGLPALLPYSAVREDQVNLAFYLSIAIISVSSFAFGLMKTGHNVGWTGNLATCIWGGFTFFLVVATSAAVSVVVIRAIDHNL